MRSSSDFVIRLTVDRDTPCPIRARVSRETSRVDDPWTYASVIMRSISPVRREYLPSTSVGEPFSLVRGICASMWPIEVSTRRK